MSIGSGSFVVVINARETLGWTWETLSIFGQNLVEERPKKGLRRDSVYFPAEIIVFQGQERRIAVFSRLKPTRADIYPAKPK